MSETRTAQPHTRRALLRAGLGCLAGQALLAPALFEPWQYVAQADAPNVVLQWNNSLLQAVQAVRAAPTVTARAIAILHTCMYDAWAAYDASAVGTFFQGNLRRPFAEYTLANKQQAVCFAAYRALQDLFPTQASQFSTLLAAQGYDPSATYLDRVSPTGIGNLVGACICRYRNHDGANQSGDLHPGSYSDYTGYQPINTPSRVLDLNRWQPLLVSGPSGGLVEQHYVTPQWEHTLPFAINGPSFLAPFVPSHYPSPAFTAQANEILQLSAQLTDQQKMIAEYWKDGPGSQQPPGHWCRFAQYVSQRDAHDLDSDVKLFFALGNALFDASIATWYTKRYYDSVRPITAIRHLFQGQKVLAFAGPYKGTQWINGEDWQPYQPASLLTPAFAEFCSGHSTFSAAAAEVLQRFTGSDLFGASVILPAGSSTIEPGAVPTSAITLSWPTFTDAANEAGLSRRYGGIHFLTGDMGGRVLGRAIGLQAWQRAWIYINNK